MAACFSCVGSGRATPATVPPGACPRCVGCGVEPDAVPMFRVDVVSVADPDRPFFVSSFEALSRQAAVVVAEQVVAEQATNPELHYGDLYAQPEEPGGEPEYLCSIEPLLAAAVRRGSSAAGGGA